jgi:hypothetical protein
MMRSSGSVTLTLAALIALAVTAGGQQPPEQRAQPAAPAPRPAPRFQPLIDSRGLVREEAFVPTPPLSGTDRRYADTEVVPAVGLEAVGRAFAKIIDGVNTLDLAAPRP